MGEPSAILNCLNDAWGRMDHCERNDFIAYMSEDLRQHIAAANGATDTKFKPFSNPTVETLENMRAALEMWSLASPADRLRFAKDTSEYRLRLITDALGEFTHQENKKGN